MVYSRGSPAHVHELRSNERKNCSKVLFERTELFEQFFLNELNWSNSSVLLSELNVDFGRPVIWPHISRSIHRTYLKLLKVYS